MTGTSDNLNLVPDTCQGMYLTENGQAMFLGNMFGYGYEVIPEATHMFLKSATGADHLFPKVTHMDLKHFEMLRRWLFTTLGAQWASTASA